MAIPENNMSRKGFILWIKKKYLPSNFCLTFLSPKEKNEQGQRFVWTGHVINSKLKAYYNQLVYYSQLVFLRLEI